MNIEPWTKGDEEGQRREGYGDGFNATFVSDCMGVDEDGNEPKDQTPYQRGWTEGWKAGGRS
jgi:hypothetical protein